MKKFGLACVFGVWAAGGQAQSLDIQDFVADAISAHPLVLEQLHIFRQTKQDQTIASSGWRPSVDLFATGGQVESEAPTVLSSPLAQENNYSSGQAELSITQNLFNGFDTVNFSNQADARVRAALFHLYDTADNVALEAVKAYLEVLKQQRLLELAQENLRSHEETLSKITRRSQSGAGRRSQLEQTEGRVARARAGLIAQRNNLEDALTEAHHLLGRYIQPIELLEPSLPEHPELNLDGMTDFALVRHPAMAVATSNIAAALFDEKRSKSKYYPKLNLRLAQQVGQDLNGIRGDTEEASVALTLEYNFYNGGADRAEQKKKISAVHEHQQYAVRVRRQIINTLRLAWMGDRSLQEQLSYLRQHVIQSQKTMVSYQEEFFIGQRDLINLLDAKNELNSAQNAYISAYYDSFAARFRILEGTGQLFEGLGLKPIVEDENLRVARISAKGRDRLPLKDNIDGDTEIDKSDHCDNSLAGMVVNEFGCAVPQDRSGPAVQLGNSPPQPVNDAVAVNAGDVVEIGRASLLENDRDKDGDPLTIKAFSQPKHGQLAVNAANNLVYRPAEGFLGSDTFTYIVDDGQATATATVTLMVGEHAAVDFTKAYYVNFDFNRVSLTAESRVLANRIISALLASPRVLVEMSAYTDSLGSSGYNLRLSERRAEATKQMLIKAGVSADRIYIAGRGEDEPLADNATDDGRAINRRGEFRFILQESAR
ncbi:TolC family outer membrane protein [Zhongshania guokunii]|uniref:TolC family outer membrane protein n=1 Tax=Zhongshania guokunii TaxID=641783 RepID=A0ABV3U2W5_9GAMM